MKNKKTSKTKGHEETEHEEFEVEEEVEQPQEFVSVPDMRMISLFGDVNEKKASEIIYSLFAYKEVKRLIPMDKKNPPEKFKEIVDPLEMLISTHGGSASDMFGIYDTMNMVKKQMPIHTIGMGKVMSAGVLILAAGTKGQRRIGKNCRVMLHAVIAGAQGTSHNILNEVEEIMETQEAYIKCLAKETKMTVPQIKKLIGEKKNIYLSATQAVRYGIADIII